MYKFLIYISYSYAIPIGKPLQKEIEKRGNIVKWFADIEVTNKYFSTNENVLYTIKDVIYYKPDIVLCITNLVPDFISGLKVQIFHGFNAQKRPSKRNKFSHFKIRGFFDLYCSQGPSTTKVFKQAALKKKYFEVIETGWSKVDSLFPLKENSGHQIPKILIASTFTKRLSLAHNDDVFKEISKLINSEKYKFSMVLHPKMDATILEKWSKLKSPFFTYHDTTDLIPIFKEADILFSDTSSAIQEFLIQKKPVVTFRHTLENNYLIHVNDARKIDAALNKALKYPKDLINNIDAFILELHPYFDGLSSKRVINATLDFLHKDKTHLKSKPINLIRKFKIRNQLNYFTFKSISKPHTIGKWRSTNSIQEANNLSNNTIQISAVIITFNEEEHLEKCLASLIDVVDEIVVVDSYSTDRTEEICKSFNVRFIPHKFEGYIEQKNFAITQATYNYILSLDGDEALTEQLKDSVKKVKQKWNFDGYYSNRLNNYCGQWIKHSDWYPDKKLRLFKKGMGEWKGINPHDSYSLKNSKKAGKLDGDLLHWIYRDYKEHKQKVETFSTIAAGAYFKLGIKSSVFKIIYRPTWAFFKSFFLRLGFLDGKNGYRISLQFYYVTLFKYKKLYNLWKNK